VSLDDARVVVERAIAAGVFPAAAVDVGDSSRSIWSDAAGTLTFNASSPATTVDTPFDLASLTKPIATTTVVMELVRIGALQLDARVADLFSDWRGMDREGVTVRDLLEHASGLPARLVDSPPGTRREFEHEICATSLEYALRTQSVYSDLGFILLGFLAADTGGASLQTLFERLMSVKADATYLGFVPPPRLRPLCAPTRPMDADPRRGRTLAGEVHDNYAAALGGVAGHAGLFGTATAVGAFARVVLRAARLKGSGSNVFTGAQRARLSDGARSARLSNEARAARPADGARGARPADGARGARPSDEARAARPSDGARGARLSDGARAFQASVPDPFSPELVALFTTKSTVPGSSRALGWDTMLPTSSCGGRMSPQAFGHVGFTGTSLWIDPARDRYFVLLTNRVCGGGTLDDMRAVRRAFHDALADV
jgi:CubicO group peptidase (beta-lactamase class C family)